MPRPEGRFLSDAERPLTAKALLDQGYPREGRDDFETAGSLRFRVRELEERLAQDLLVLECQVEDLLAEGRDVCGDQETNVLMGHAQTIRHVLGLPLRDYGAEASTTADILQAVPAAPREKVGLARGRRLPPSAGGAGERGVPTPPRRSRARRPSRGSR